MTKEGVKDVPIDKFICIQEFSEQLSGDQETAQQTSEIMEGIRFMEACSPWLSGIAAKRPGEAAACYKLIKRFLREQDPQATLTMLLNEETDDESNYRLLRLVNSKR